ncbi:MAG: anthranilate synthase component I family protein [Cytophagales bacterium]|nr:MAG: anthranilate synthase component I family protein [Cytophagales bacterium]
MYNKLTFPLQDKLSFINNALNWAKQFNHFAYYTSNDIEVLHQGFQTWMGIDSLIEIAPKNSALKTLDQLLENHPNEWWCGCMSYELKNEIEHRHHNTNSSKQSLLYFFKPKYLFFFNASSIEIWSWDISPKTIYNTIIDFSINQPKKNSNFLIKHTTSKESYIEKINLIKQHIKEGDVYELNYCIDFSAQTAGFDAITTFLKLNSKSPMPFAGIFKTPEQTILCASPERFLKKSSDLIIIQPIKGTIPRVADNNKDIANQKKLRNSPKEQAENMMIVDLSRNDLAKTSAIGSVKVEEIFGIYSFTHLHQMISTISARLKPNIKFSEIIKSTFPMGSMTGAPKIKAIDLINDYETNPRGYFSGAIGYIQPNGDFDFNVVIRSILYCSNDHELRFYVGSAITFDSDAEKEYEECMLKVASIFEVLQSN